MEKTIYALLILLAVTIFGVTYTLNTSDVNYDPYQPSIVNDWGVEQRTEDLTGMLILPDLPFYNYPFEPTPEIEYLIYLEGENKISNLEVLEVYNQLSEEFDQDFYIYGYQEEWSLITWETEDLIYFDQLVVGAMYVDYRGNPLILEDLKTVYQVAERVAEKFDLFIEEGVPFDEAVVNSEMLYDFFHQYDQWVTLVLSADPDKPFSGRKIHEIARGFGLEWGEHNQYHWMNSDEYVGSEHLFSLGNYDEDFIPEEMMEADYTSMGIVVGFYLPTCAAPVEVYQNMLTVISYFQGQLGGTIVNQEGLTLEIDDLQLYSQVLGEMTQEMEDFGIIPGHNLALWLFP